MPDSLSNTLLIAVGGALGSVARYWAGVLIAPYGESLPWGTILINIIGSFAITFFGSLTLASGRFPLEDGWRLFFMVGICGGFTTFSSFSLQTFDLLNANMPGRALVNVSVSVVLCVVAAAAGYYAASGINGGEQKAVQIQVDEEFS